MPVTTEMLGTILGVKLDEVKLDEVKLDDGRIEHASGIRYKEYDDKIVTELLRPLTADPNIVVIELTQPVDEELLYDNLYDRICSPTPPEQIIIPIPSPNHFSGLYLTKNPSGEYTATFINPSGQDYDEEHHGPITQVIEQFVEGDIRYSPTRLQYDNKHGGAFTSFILRELASKRMTLVPVEDNPYQVTLQGHEREMPNISEDAVGREASDRIGAHIRALHYAQISGSEDLPSYYETIYESIDNYEQPAAKRDSVGEVHQEGGVEAMEVEGGETQAPAPSAGHTVAITPKAGSREASAGRPSQVTATSAVSVLTAKEDIRISHRVQLIPVAGRERPKIKAKFAVSTSERTHVALTTPAGAVKDPTKTQGDHVSAYAAIVEMLCTVLAGSDIKESVKMLKDIAKVLLDDTKKFDAIVDKAEKEYEEDIKHVHLPEKTDLSYTAAKIGKVTLMMQFIEKSGNGLLECINLAKSIAYAKQGRRDTKEGSRVDNATHALEAVKAIEDLRGVLFDEGGRPRSLTEISADEQKHTHITRFVEKFQKPRSAIRSGLGQLGSATGKDKLKTLPDNPNLTNLSEASLLELRNVIKDYDAQANSKMQRPRRGAQSQQAELTPEQRKSQLIVSKIGDLFDFSCAKRRNDANIRGVLSSVTARHIAICFIAFKLDKFPVGLQSNIVDDFVDDVVMGHPIAKKVGVTPGFHGQGWGKYVDKDDGRGMVSEDIKAAVKTFLRDKGLMKAAQLDAATVASAVVPGKPGTMPTLAPGSGPLMAAGKAKGALPDT